MEKLIKLNVLILAALLSIHERILESLGPKRSLKSTLSLRKTLMSVQILISNGAYDLTVTDLL